MCYQDMEILANTSSCFLPASLTETIWRRWGITDLIIDLKAAGWKVIQYPYVPIKKERQLLQAYIGSSWTEFTCCSYCPNFLGIVCNPFYRVLALGTLSQTVTVSYFLYIHVLCPPIHVCSSLQEVSKFPCHLLPVGGSGFRTFLVSNVFNISMMSWWLATQNFSQKALRWCYHPSSSRNGW